MEIILITFKIVSQLELRSQQFCLRLQFVCRKVVLRKAKLADPYNEELYYYFFFTFFYLLSLDHGRHNERHHRKVSESVSH